MFPFTVESVVVGNGSFSGKEVLVGATLDRLTHRCHILEATGESYRLRDAKRRQGSGSKGRRREPADSAPEERGTGSASRTAGKCAPERHGVRSAHRSTISTAFTGFQNYYALLNCGFRLRPTAGTASGVHPVPLGFGRVYVNCPDKFSYDAWVRGLDRGESFVTTGPMLLVRVNGKGPGNDVQAGRGEAGVSDHGRSPERRCRWTAWKSS